MWQMLKVAMTCALFAVAATGRNANAEPLATQGIGTSSCARLAADVSPADGLNNPVNLMLYAWVQGYVSAANIALLEGGAKHIDMSALDEGKVLNLVLSFCKANPDKKPISAIDKFIRDVKKVDAKEKDVFNPWEQ